MKLNTQNSLFLMLAIVSISALLYFNSHFHATIAPTATTSNNRLAQKHEPSEQFFMQRAYPDRNFDIKAYKNALRTAQVNLTNRNDAPEGFEEAWTTQGPGNIGARINSILLHPTNDSIIYAGFSQGGVWKTEDAGQNWNPIFDDQLFLAIGDIEVDPNDPETIYVGTGDLNISGYPFIGDGLYRSRNGGETWEHLGLEEQRIISKIIIDPSNSDIIYVATMGLPFERTAERGLYKSINGGDTWEQVLFVTSDAGIIDMVMSPSDPLTLYAASWNRIRNNSESLVFGHDAHIYKTTDGGNQWEILAGGLPNNQAMSRIGLAISKENSDKLYAAYVDSTFQLYNIYRSDNAGNTWTTLDISEAAGMSQNALGGFGWYFGKIHLNPQDDNDIFLLGVDLWRSFDGGTNWFSESPPWWTYEVHADKHDLAFTNNGDYYLATDGGLYFQDRSHNEWFDVENIPTTQFYRTAYNPHNPDLYYGGAQDNGTTGGNADDINNWERIFGGDGFQTVFHPDNPDIFYVETQRGNINYTNDGGMTWQGANAGINSNESRNWDMPYIMSPHNPNVLYTGTHTVYTTYNDGAPNWLAISENLNTNDSINTRYQHITTLNESPLVQGLLYVGMGNGGVFRTQDGGGAWELINEDLPNRYVTSIHASPDFENVIYVSHSGYRNNQNEAKIHKSTDRGDTWIPINSDLPDLAINDIFVIPNTQDKAIFVATDGGVYGTLDAGISWHRLGSEMPFVPVYDIEWNVAKNELIAATFARGITTFPLDEIGLDYNPNVAVENTTPTIAPKLNVYPNPSSDYINIAFANTETGKDAQLVILDAQGKLVEEKTMVYNLQNETKIPIHHLAAGTYFIKVKIRHGIYQAGFVKM